VTIKEVAFHFSKEVHRTNLDLVEEEVPVEVPG
jgi:hypothetical protein